MLLVLFCYDVQIDQSERTLNNPAADVTSLCPSDGFIVLSNGTDPTFTFDITAELESNGASLAAEYFYTFRLCVSKRGRVSNCTEREVLVLTTQAPRITAR